MTLRVAVIGAGLMGTHHARNYSDIPGVELCAVADIDGVRIKQVAEKYHCKLYLDYREMLAAEKPDAVSVTVPTSGHAEVALAALEAGAHVLVEKPLASTLEDAEKIIARAKSVKRKLAVGHIERFNPAVQELKRCIQNGDLGTIFSAVARRVGIMPPRVKDANVLLDLAVHDIDVMQYLFEVEPEEIYLTAGCALLSNRHDHAEILLKYGDIGCFVQVNWVTPVKVRTLSVTGDGGHAELSYVDQTLEMYPTIIERDYDGFGEFVVQFGPSPGKTMTFPKREPLRAELEDFVHAIEEDRPVAVDGAEGLKALRAIHRAMEVLS